MERRREKNDRGVILLETLLTLPVYLVMLTGLFWLGELCMARLTLTHAERLRLWEKGNWNDHSEIKEADIFHFLSRGTGNPPALVTGESDFSDTFAGTSAANDWGNLVSGRAKELKTRRSEWSWGITEFMRKNLWRDLPGSSEAPGKNPSPMYVRGVDATGNLVMLFRAGDGGRHDINWSGNTVWNDIYLGEWGGFITTDGQGSPAGGVTEYPNRDGTYNEWSR